MKPVADRLHYSTVNALILLLTLSLAPAPPAAPRAAGPPVPGADAITRVLAKPYRESLGKDIPGMVVVIEDSMPSMVERATIATQIYRGKVRFNLGGPGSFGTMPAWQDPSAMMQGGNVVHRNYSLGSVGF